MKCETSPPSLHHFNSFVTPHSHRFVFHIARYTVLKTLYTSLHPLVEMFILTPTPLLWEAFGHATITARRLFTHTLYFHHYLLPGTHTNCYDTEQFWIIFSKLGNLIRLFSVDIIKYTYLDSWRPRVKNRNIHINKLAWLMQWHSKTLTHVNMISTINTFK